MRGSGSTGSLQPCSMAKKSSLAVVGVAGGWEQGCTAARHRCTLGGRTWKRCHRNSCSPQSTCRRGSHASPRPPPPCTPAPPPPLTHSPQLLDNGFAGQRRTQRVDRGTKRCVGKQALQAASSQQQSAGEAAAAADPVRRRRQAASEAQKSLLTPKDASPAAHPCSSTATTTTTSSAAALQEAAASKHLQHAVDIAGVAQVAQAHRLAVVLQQHQGREAHGHRHAHAQQDGAHASDPAVVCWGGASNRNPLTQQRYLPARTLLPPCPPAPSHPPPPSSLRRCTSRAVVEGSGPSVPSTSASLAHSPSLRCPPGAGSRPHRQLGLPLAPCATQPPAQQGTARGQQGRGTGRRGLTAVPGTEYREVICTS